MTINKNQLSIISPYGHFLAARPSHRNVERISNSPETYSRTDGKISELQLGTSEDQFPTNPFTACLEVSIVMGVPQ